MAEPKKRLTSTRSGNRRSQLRLKAINLMSCPKCKTMIKGHMVCYVCGTYKGEKIVDMDKREKKKAAHLNEESKAETDEDDKKKESK